MFLQQVTISQPSCLISGSKQLQEQGFSLEVQRELLPLKCDLQGQGTSQRAVFEKWYGDSLVDFSSPPVKQVSDFCTYLFHDLDRRPSAIYGNCTPIVDSLGPALLQCSQSSEINRLLSNSQEFQKSTQMKPACCFKCIIYILYSVQYLIVLQNLKC